MIELKIGDIVQLKSGGPKMTVNSISAGTHVYCQWFAGSKLEGGNFDINTIIKIADDMKSEKSRE